MLSSFQPKPKLSSEKDYTQQEQEILDSPAKSNTLPAQTNSNVTSQTKLILVRQNTSDIELPTIPKEIDQTSPFQKKTTRQQKQVRTMPTRKHLKTAESIAAVNPQTISSSSLTNTLEITPVDLSNFQNLPIKDKPQDLSSQIEAQTGGNNTNTNGLCNLTWREFCSNSFNLIKENPIRSTTVAAGSLAFIGSLIGRTIYVGSTQTSNINLVCGGLFGGGFSLAMSLLVDHAAHERQLDTSSESLWDTIKNTSIRDLCSSSVQFIKEHPVKSVCCSVGILTAVGGIGGFMAASYMPSAIAEFAFGSCITGSFNTAFTTVITTTVNAIVDMKPENVNPIVNNVEADSSLQSSAQQNTTFYESSL